MKTLVIALASAFTVIGTAANAAYDHYPARVTDVNPVYTGTGPRQECWNTRGGERCRTVDSGEQLLGYYVRYSYNGREYTTRMNRDPGRRLVPGRDIRDDGTPYATATFDCKTVNPIDRPGWCDQEGQGG